MTQVIETKAVVGPNGALQLDVTLDERLAGHAVNVVLEVKEPGESVDKMPAQSENDPEYLSVLKSLHGAIDDPTFTYPLSGVYREIPAW